MPRVSLSYFAHRIQYNGQKYSIFVSKYDINYLWVSKYVLQAFWSNPRKDGGLGNQPLKND